MHIGDEASGEQPPPEYYDQIAGAVEQEKTEEELPRRSRRNFKEDTAPVFLPGSGEFDRALSKISPSIREKLYGLLRAEFKFLKVLPEKDSRREGMAPSPEAIPDVGEETDN